MYSQKFVYIKYIVIISLIINEFSVFGQDLFNETDSVQNNKTQNFYDSLIIKAGDKKYSKLIYQLIFKSPSQPKKIENIDQKTINQNFYENRHKKIKEIIVTNYIDFERNSVYPLNKINTLYTKSLNLTHVKTSKKVISGYLTFKKGDTIQPEIFEDNERLLRELDFIRDAKIIIIPDSLNPEFASVNIFVQDQWSKAIDAEFDDLYSGYVSIIDKNIAGTGQRFEARLFFNNKYDPVFGPGAFFRLRNIKKTLINIDLNYKKTHRNGDSRIDLYRKFYTPEMKYAGGITALKSHRYGSVDYIDSSLTNVYIEYEMQDIWFARAFIFRTMKEKKIERTQLIVSARASNYHYFKRPEISPSTFYQFHNHYIIFGSIALTKPLYFKTNMVYNFGRTEDIPFGHYVDLHFGRDFAEFFNRNYFGINLSKGQFFKKFGYLNAFAGLGSYIYKHDLQQAIIRTDLDYFSNLFIINNYYTRQFLKIRYTNGIKRFEYENINLNDKNGITGLKSKELKGIQKVAINFESVLFSPLYFYGFRFVFFAFSDFGLVTFNKNLFLNNNFFSGFGAGIRFRNEFLVFETFQIRFSIYPKIPDDANPAWIILSDEEYRKPRSFRFEEPRILKFE